eukprot:CAMPEP_0185751992 /NCGR_PEP_ID=MMETSP1174-20130828/10765_1 /TAXON_ID=35687 /ORGANISM="Dictyocha speculum, Strain CCMP1381" /LENGTH=152 /DNA_ID=CAMNT_0028429223 /DNA_START=54 /DNA_END=512 /DNA_ORIENTATION=-
MTQAFREVARSYARTQTLVLLTGDGNENSGRASFVELVDQALMAGWNVEVWSWRRACSRKYVEFQKQYAETGRYSLVYLDEWISDICVSTSNASRNNLGSSTLTHTRTSHRVHEGPSTRPQKRRGMSEREQSTRHHHRHTSHPLKGRFSRTL